MLSSVSALLSIGVYRYIIFAMSSLYFSVTGVQYWGTSYLHVALLAPMPLVNALFIVCAATGPTLGVFFGGWAVDVCGGYKGAKQRVVALELCCFFGMLGCLASIPITFVSHVLVAVPLLWLTLFFGAAILPACSGIIVSIVPRRHRPVSSSLSLVVFNLFGYFLSLVLSGFLMQVLSSQPDLECDNKCSLTWGFRLVLFWSVLALLLLSLALRSAMTTTKLRRKLADDEGIQITREESVD